MYLLTVFLFLYSPLSHIVIIRPPAFSPCLFLPMQTESVQQLQAPSNTTQPSHQGNTHSNSSGQPYYASAQAQNNNNSTMSSTQQQQQQPPSSMSSTRQRTVSGGFEIVKAGPPREGKMDLLPYPHSSGHHHNQQAGNSTSGNHPGQVTASSTQRDTSSSRHRSGCCLFYQC